MEKLEGWKCYAHQSCGMDREEFARMLLFDGCYLLGYIIDHLDRVDRHAAPAPDSPTGSAAGGGSKDEIVVRDSFYLLENQIPFRVLERIYDYTTEHTRGDVLPKLAKFVQALLRERFYIGATPANFTQPRPHHLLHLMHQQFVSTAPETNSHIAQVNSVTQKKDGTGRWRRATEYCSRANVRFERLVFSDRVKSVLDVSLVGGTLQMPRLRIDTNTWTILRNLMALEQLLRQTSTSPDPTTELRVTAYCLFMSQVACTAEDVELLGRAGVVEHFLGSDAEAAAGFGNLCKGVVLDVEDPNSNYLKPRWHDLERRYRSRKHNLVAWFRQTHCRNQCYAAAFVVAVILFACAVLQVVFAGLDYGKK